MPDVPARLEAECDVPHWQILLFADCDTPWWGLAVDTEPQDQLPEAA